MQRWIPGLVALALVALANLHLPVLQVVAWTGMIVTYSRDVSLGEALDMTFDGDHPCPLCCSIQKEQTRERQQLAAQPALERLTLFVEPASGWRHALVPVAGLPLDQPRWRDHVAPPPVPPPRAAA